LPYSPMELANAFIRSGELPDALQALDAQLAALPDDDEARRLRAAVLLRLPGETHFQKAQADLEALSEKTTPDFVQLSVLAERLNNLSRAVNAMLSACQEAPDDERLLERLMSLYLKQNDYAGAIAVARSQPRAWRWLQWEADLLVLAGEFAAAVEVYQQALTLLEERFDYQVNRVVGAIRTRMLLANAYACRRSGQIDRAEGLYRAAQHYYPNDTTIFFNLGLLMALCGNLDEAVTQCRAALDATENLALRSEMLNTLQTETAFAALAARIMG
jgi:tetratricopeptide (TPR) repeat protein